MKIARNHTVTIFRCAAFVLALIAGGGHLFGGEIQEAALAGDMVKVVELVRANPKLVFSKGQATSINKVMTDVNDLRVFLEDDRKNLDEWKSASCTPLFFAVLGGHKEVAGFLLANRADVNAKGNLGSSP